VHGIGWARFCGALKMGKNLQALRDIVQILAVTVAAELGYISGKDLSCNRRLPGVIRDSEWFVTSIPHPVPFVGVRVRRLSHGRCAHAAYTRMAP